MHVRSRYRLLLPLALALSLPAYAEVNSPGDNSADSRNIQIEGAPSKAKAKPFKKPAASVTPAKNAGPSKTDKGKTAPAKVETKETTETKGDSKKTELKTDTQAETKADITKESESTPAVKTDSADAGAKSETVKIGLAQSENSFGLTAYKGLGEGNKNFFISPFSIHSCLHLVFDGASGATAEEMGKVLNLSVAQKAAANTEYVGLLEEIEPASQDEAFQFSAANSVWANKVLKLKAGFVDTAKTVFRADVKSLDFSGADSLGQINSWVSDKTHGKIPKIIDSLSPEQAMVAVNAAYFKAPWQTVFKKDATRHADFKADGGTKKVSMMDVSGIFHYLENDQFQAVELPYAGGRESCIVMLPREGSSLAKLRQSLSSANWDAWVDKMDNKAGELFLPKFKMEYQLPLRDYLVQAGMKQAFEKSADFSQIAESDPNAAVCAKLSQVLHKTFVKVNEDGTEAAAATATTERMLSLKVDTDGEPFKMVVNRPFFFAIMNWKTRAILFLGQVADPVYE
jgi:serine protease inhibitor